MVAKIQKRAVSHFHPLRIDKKGGILELSDERIAALALITVHRAEEKVLNEYTNNGWQYSQSICRKYNSL